VACVLPGTPASSAGILFEHVPTDTDAPTVIEATIYDAASAFRAPIISSRPTCGGRAKRNLRRFLAPLMAIPTALDHRLGDIFREGSGQLTALAGMR